MRKSLLAFLLFALLIFSSCEAERLPAGGEEKNMPPTNTGSQADNLTVEEQDAVNYIFVSNLIVGYYKDGKWTDADQTPVFVADLLKQNAYYCYNQEELMGKSTKLTFSYIDDLGNSFSADGELLIPYADENDAESRTVSFYLPAELPEAVSDVALDGYNRDVEFNIDFPTDDHGIPLVITASHDPLPGVIAKIQGPFLNEDLEAITADLGELGVPGAVANITEEYAYDFDGDGYKERLIFANNPESLSPYFSQEEVENNNSGYYYMVLCKNGNGYTTVTSWCNPYNFDEHTLETFNLPGEYYTDSIRRIYFEGIFDLNGDGVFELCLSAPEYEWGSVFVFCVDEEGRWHKIMTGNYGM